MPCYRPLQGYRRRDGGWTANPAEGFADFPMSIPCGQCIGCRLEYARVWAIRCIHEAKMHDESYFLTLTYDDAHLPPGGTLVKEHLTLFFKRYRKKYEPAKIRYYACGEYGDTTERPHYHVLLFGHRLPDLVLYQQTPHGALYESETLNNIWGLGRCMIGNLTFESAAYVARYSTKKLTGYLGQLEYKRRGLVPPYAVMSRRPGIGSAFYDQFQADIFPADEVIVRGQKARPPRYYLKKLKELDPETYEAVSLERIGKNPYCGMTPDEVDYHRGAGAEIAKARLNLKKTTI